MKKAIVTSITLLAAGTLLTCGLVGCGKQPSVPEMTTQVTTVESDTEIETSLPEEIPVSFDWECERGVLPDDAQEAFDQAFSMFVGSDVEPIALMGTQVVAGTNYAILCKVTPVVPDAVSSLKVVTIYKDLQGDSVLLGFSDFDMDALYGSDSGQTDEELLVGGWQDAVSGNAIPDEVMQYIDTNGRTPVAYIGYNPVERRHAVFCSNPFQIAFIDEAAAKDGMGVPSAKYIGLAIADFANHGEVED